MLKLGLIREGKIPADNRVAFTPAQCKWIVENKGIQIFVQPSEKRCYRDEDYISAGIPVQENLSNCDLLFGIKEVPVEMLLPDKTYFFFSHTRKMQPQNQKILQSVIQKGITLIDYELLFHDDGTRVLGFGFFAGVVGAHNAMMAYGERTGLYSLKRVFELGNFEDLIHSYFKLKVPPVKVAVTGSGRVAQGIIEVMHLMGIKQVDPALFTKKMQFAYPVYVHLKGSDLYRNEASGSYDRDEFHQHPERYRCLFPNYLMHTDILLNGVYWDIHIPKLFKLDDLSRPDFRIQTIGDITHDPHGSVPWNLGDATVEDPVYGIDKHTMKKTAPFLPDSLDLMAVSNLPNELPVDASRYFGEQLINYIVDELGKDNSVVIENATTAKNGRLTPRFEYLKEYAEKL